MGVIWAIGGGNQDALKSVSNCLALAIVDAFFQASDLVQGQYNGQTMVLDSKKLLCHLILLILQHVPNQTFNFAELGADLDESLVNLKACIGYVGCVING